MGSCLSCKTTTKTRFPKRYFWRLKIQELRNECNEAQRIMQYITQPDQFLVDDLLALKNHLDNWQVSLDEIEVFLKSKPSSSHTRNNSV